MYRNQLLMSGHHFMVFKLIFKKQEIKALIELINLHISINVDNNYFSLLVKIWENKRNSLVTNGDQLK